MDFCLPLVLLLCVLVMAWAMRGRDAAGSAGPSGRDAELEDLRDRVARLEAVVAELMDARTARTRGEAALEVKRPKPVESLPPLIPAEPRSPLPPAMPIQPSASSDAYVVSPAPVAARVEPQAERVALTTSPQVSTAEPMTTQPPLPEPVAPPPAVAVLSAPPSVPVQALPVPPLPPAGPSLEQRVAANWMGIGGAVAVVLGIGFLGVYAALRMGPFGRFLMVDGFAVVLLALSFLLGRASWGQGLSRWVRSASAAVFLLGCVSSVLFTPMRWVESDGGGMALLALGVGANLILGFVAREQTFAALHVVLSLVALALTPSMPTPFVLGGVVAAVGGLVALRNPRWDVHLAVSTTAWTVYHLLWFVRGGRELSVLYAHSVPVVVALVVGGTAAAVHYRRVYEPNEGSAIPLLSHAWGWALLALNLAIHHRGSWHTPILLLIGAVLTHRTSAIARRRGVEWLYVTDRLVSLAWATIAALSLLQHDVDLMDVLLLTLLPPLVFLANESRYPHRLLVIASSLLVQAVTGALVGVAMLRLAVPSLLFSVLASAHVGLAHEIGVLLGASLLIGVVLPYAHGQASKVGSGVPMVGGHMGLGVGWTVVATMTGVAMLVLDRDGVWPPLVAMLAVAAAVALRAWVPSLGLAVASVIGVLMVLTRLGVAAVLHGDVDPWSIVLSALWLPLIALWVDRRARAYRASLLGDALTLFAAVGAGVWVLVTVEGGATWTTTTLVAFFAGAAGVVATMVTTPAAAEGAPPSSLLDVPLAVLVATISLLWLHEQTALASAGVAVLLLALVALRRLAPAGLLERGMALAILLVGAAIASLAVTQSVSASTGIAVAGLWIAGVAAAVFAPPSDEANPTAALYVTVAWATAMGAAWRFTTDRSAFLPGVLWVALGVLTVELAGLVSARVSKAGGALLRWLAVASLVAFAIRHGLVDLQNEARLGPFSIRGVIELYAGAVATWWALTSEPQEGAPPTAWLLEGALALVLLFIQLDVDPALWGPTWLALAFALVEAGRILPSHARLAGAGVALAWAAFARVGLLTSRIVDPSLDSLVPVWARSLATLVGGVFFFLRFRAIAPGWAETPVSWEGALRDLARRDPTKALLWPVFAATAVFLDWTFDDAMLTLSWGVLCFVLFAVALALRDRPSRRLAMGALALVLVRLVVFDLRGTDFFIKAIVFLGIGVVLLATSTLASRFLDRFDAEEK